MRFRQFFEYTFFDVPESLAHAPVALLTAHPSYSHSALRLRLPCTPALLPNSAFGIRHSALLLPPSRHPSNLQFAIIFSPRRALLAKHLDTPRRALASFS